jgi:NWD NACHT NTPase-like protein
LDIIDGEELETKLTELVECKWKKVKSGPEIVIGDWKVGIKDQAYNIIRTVIAFQRIIGGVVSAEPHAALAWAGVVAILPVSIK